MSPPEYCGSEELGASETGDPKKTSPVEIGISRKNTTVERYSVTLDQNRLGGSRNLRARRRPYPCLDRALEILGPEVNPREIDACLLHPFPRFVVQRLKRGFSISSFFDFACFSISAAFKRLPFRQHSFGPSVSNGFGCLVGLTFALTFIECRVSCGFASLEKRDRFFLIHAPGPLRPKP
jgi:hypothetical protein